MSTDFVKNNEFSKLERALLSGLPNEVDFAINVCTLLSSESRHSLLLRKAQNLLQLLMAHIGIFSDGTYVIVKKISLPTVDVSGLNQSIGMTLHNDNSCR
jgi:hypothetical protein